MTIPYDDSTYDSLELDRLINVDRWCLLAYESLVNSGELSATVVSYFNNCDTIEQMLCLKTLVKFLSNNGNDSVVVSEGNKTAFINKIDLQLRSEFLGNIAEVLGSGYGVDRFYRTIYVNGARPRNPGWGITSTLLSSLTAYTTSPMLDYFGPRLVADFDVGNSSTLVLNGAVSPKRVTTIRDSAKGPLVLKSLTPTIGSQSGANYDSTKHGRGMFQNFQDYYQIQNSTSNNAKLKMSESDWLIGAVVNVTTHGWFFWSQAPGVSPKGDLFVGTNSVSDTYNSSLGGLKYTGMGQTGLQVVVCEFRNGNITLDSYSTSGSMTVYNGTSVYTQRGMFNNSTYGQISGVSYSDVYPFVGYCGGLTIVRSPVEGDRAELAFQLCNRWGIVPVT